MTATTHTSTKLVGKKKPRKRKYRAVIHTNLKTGVHRVFCKKVVNGEIKIVEKINPTSAYKVTGYPSLANVMRHLKGATPVYFDEQIEWNGQNCELSLFDDDGQEVA